MRVARQSQFRRVLDGIHVAPERAFETTVIVAAFC